MTTPPTPETPRDIDAPPQEVETVVTAKDRILQVQERVDAAQAEVFGLQQRLEQLKFIQQQLTEGQTLEDADNALLQQEGIDATGADLAARVDAKVDELTQQEEAKRRVLDQTSSRLEALRKQLSPEDELFMQLERAGKMLSGGEAKMADVIQAIVLAIAALQKYFKYLTGELERMTGKSPESTRSSSEQGPAVSGTPAEHTRKLLQETGAATVTDLQQKKTQERDALQTRIPTIETNRNTARGKLVTAQESLKSLQSKSDAKADDLRAAQTAVDTAQREVDQLDRELTDAQRKLEQIKADITAIDSALNAITQATARLRDLLAKAVLALPAGDLATALAAVELGTAANGLDLQITFKAGTDLPKLLQAFKNAGFTNLDALGINAATGEITSTTQLLEALQRVITRAVPPKPAA